MALNQGYFKIQGKDLSFKRIFSPKDLNAIYFIELNRTNFEWTWVNWTRNIYQIFLGFPSRF
jgi:hypothetical protein